MKRWPLFVTLGLIVIFVGYFTWFDFGRHAKTNSGRFDLGNVEQIAWNVTHGHGFTMTDPYGTAQVSRLAFHADPFLLLLTPFYMVVPRTETLLLLQVLMVASGALAVFFISRRILKDDRWGVLFSAIYLLNPGLNWATIFDVHAVTFATPIILWALWAVISKRYWATLIFVVLAMLTKEEVGLMLVAVGIYTWLVQKNKSWGLILIFVPLLWSLAMFFIVLPHFRLLTGGGDEVYRSAFGTGALSIVAGAIKRPLVFLHYLFARQNMVYGWQLFSATGIWGLFSPWWLAALPEYAINALSLKPAQHLIISHYTSGLTPWLMMSVMAGTAWISARLSKRFSLRPVNIVLVIWLIGWTGYGVWTTGPLPLTPHDQTKFVTWSNPYAAPVRQWAKLIPTSAKVSVTNDIGSQFATRQYLYSFPFGVEQSDYVVVLENHTTPVVATNQEVSAAVAQLRQNPHWQVLEHTGDLTVLKRQP